MTTAQAGVLSSLTVCRAGLVTGAGPVDSPRPSIYNKSALGSMQEAHLRQEEGWVQLQHSSCPDGQTLNVAYGQRVCMEVCFETGQGS